MNAGRLDSKALIQRRADTRASDGSVVTAWRDVAMVPAGLKYLSGSKTTESNQRTGEADATITIRYHSSVAAIDSTHRVKIGTLAFEVIEAIPSPGGRPERIDIRGRRIA